MKTISFDPNNFTSKDEIAAYTRFIAKRNKAEEVASVMKKLDDMVDVDFAQGKGKVSAGEVDLYNIMPKEVPDRGVHKVGGNLEYNVETGEINTLFASYGDSQGSDLDAYYSGTAKINARQDRTEYLVEEQNYAWGSRCSYMVDKGTGVIAEIYEEYPNH